MKRTIFTIWAAGATGMDSVLTLLQSHSEEFRFLLFLCNTKSFLFDKGFLKLPCVNVFKMFNCIVVGLLQRRFLLWFYVRQECVNLAECMMMNGQKHLLGVYRAIPPLFNLHFHCLNMSIYMLKWHMTSSKVQMFKK